MRQGKIRKRGKKGGNRPTGGRKPQHVARFTGSSANMLGHVFQVNGEQRKRGQFKDTLDMLRIYTLKNMQKEMSMLSCFLVMTSPPEVEEPIEPEIKKGI